MTVAGKHLDSSDGTRPRHRAWWRRLTPTLSPQGRGSVLYARRALMLGAVLVLALRTAPGRAVDREQGLKPPRMPGVPDFVELKPIVLPVIDHERVARQVGILLTLELAEGQEAATIEPLRRQLMDAFIRELHIIYSARSTADRVVDESVIKQRLLRTADGVLGKGVVHAILVKRLVEQR